ncbi:hypothetical protein EsDP_00001953 [Epichloe bromicola]|uniref:Uncharacterized protein n=1 Tax=Epichloe bromicola TaxID=79588 RepID=A0ABQ0CJC6_9HYPO
METSDTQLQPLRASKSSRLPGPAVHSGLAEMSDSQHNARVQSSIPAPPAWKHSKKREIPQPAQQPDPKRKPSLADRAAEYPAPPSAAIPNIGKLPIKGQTLPQIKRHIHHCRGLAGQDPKAKAPGHELQMGTDQKNLSMSQQVVRMSSDIDTASKYRPLTLRTSNLTKHNIEGEEAEYICKPLDISGSLGNHSQDTEKDSNLAGFAAWDVDGRVNSVDVHFNELKDMVSSSLAAQKVLEDAMELAKSRVAELEDYRQKLEARNDVLQRNLDVAKEEERHMRHELEKLRWEHSRDAEDRDRRHKETIDDLSRQHRTAIQDLSRELDQLKDEDSKEHQARLDGLTRHYQQELEDERSTKDREIQDLKARMGNEQQDLHLELQRKDGEIREARFECDGRISRV